MAPRQPPSPSDIQLARGGATRCFTRRRYVLLCLVLVVLERSDRQISLGRLAEEIVLAALQPGLARPGRAL